MTTTSTPTRSATVAGRRGWQRAAGLAAALIVCSACAGADEIATLDDGGAIPATTTGPAATDDSAEDIDAAPLSTGVPDAIRVTVPPATYDIADPVPFDEPADFGDGVVVRLVEHRAIDVVTKLPGEIGGAAVLLTLEFTNRSSVPTDLGAVTVDLVLVEQTSANQVTTDPASPVSGALPAGGSRTGIYVFTVPPDARADVELTVRYAASAPMVVFSGSLLDE